MHNLAPVSLMAALICVVATIYFAKHERKAALLFGVTALVLVFVSTLK